MAYCVKAVQSGEIISVKKNNNIMIKLSIIDSCFKFIIDLIVISAAVYLDMYSSRSSEYDKGEYYGIHLCVWVL